MPAATVDDLLRQGLLQAKDSDPARVKRWLARSRLDLDLASQPGHHRAAIDAATVVVGAEHRALLRRLDRARRFRNDALYGDVASAGIGEFEQLIKDVGWLLDEAERRLGGGHAA